jgi:serine/threonine-protein kinase
MLERELGSGAWPRWTSPDLRHQRPVALKVLHPGLAQARGPERFLREIQIVAQLQHARIRPLFPLGSADGFSYYPMPYVEGVSPRAWITEAAARPK